MAAKEDGTSLQASVTDNKVYLDPEDQRQYDESRKFIERNPQYQATADNGEMMIDWLELRNVNLTAESLQQAYECLFNGAPEPKVMSPTEFFKKVEPLTSLPSMLKFEPISSTNSEWWGEDLPEAVPDPNYDALMKKGVWAGDVKPGLKTVAGALKGDGQKPDFDLANQMAMMLIKEQQKLMDAKAEQLAEQESWKKPVAKMPEAWYSNEVVELNSGRRIKNEDD